MATGDELNRNWMAYTLSLSEELRLESAIREVAAHPDNEKVRDLTTSLMRQNFHQQQLLTNAIAYISELEMVMLLGTQEPSELSAAYVDMARELFDEMGLG